MSFSRLSRIAGAGRQYKVSTTLPFTAGTTGKFQVKETSRDSETSPLKYLTDSWGFHGTSEKMMGSQLEDHVFEHRGKGNRVYVDGSVKTAARYALKAAALSGEGDKPLVLAIHSNQSKKANKLNLTGYGFTSKGMYNYFLTEEAAVEIDGVYIVTKDE